MWKLCKFLLFSSGLFAKAVHTHWSAQMNKSGVIPAFACAKLLGCVAGLHDYDKKHQILSIVLDISPTPLSFIQWKMLNDVWWTVQTMLELMLAQLFKCCLDLDVCIFLDSFLSTANHNNSAIWFNYLNCVVLYSVSSHRERTKAVSIQFYSYCVAKSIWSISFSGFI